MKKIALALTVLTALVLPLVAQDAPKPAKKPSVPNTSASPTEGKIGYISDKKITLRLKGLMHRRRSNWIPKPKSP